MTDAYHQMAMHGQSSSGTTGSVSMTDANTGIVMGHDGMAIVAMGAIRTSTTLTIIVGLNIVKLASQMRSAVGTDANTTIWNLPAITASVAMHAGRINPGTHLTAPGIIRHSSGEHST